MADRSRLLASLFLGGFLICSGTAFAGKTTDIMSKALKQRSSGNISGAIKSFKEAWDGADNPVQKNLALLMLGDCQLEDKRYTDAVNSFRQLSKMTKTDEERAEALYKLMEAYSGLNKNDKVSGVFSELKKKYRKTAYFNVAESLMKARNIAETDSSEFEIESEPESEHVEEVKTVEKPKQEKVASKAEKVTEKNTSVKVADKKSTNKPVAKSENVPNALKPAVEAKKTTTAKNTSEVVKTQAPTGKKLDAKTTAILNEILSPYKLSNDEKDELVSKILDYQDRLKKTGETGPGQDKLLFETAEATAKFGELLEACKTYDKILSLHPSSSLVEPAYYQSIRLRAMLGVHQAVVSWSDAYLSAFPNSANAERVKALKAYSQANGKVQLNINTAKPVAAVSNRTTSNSGSAKFADKDEANAALKASSLYKTAQGKMNDGKYPEALGDLKILESKFSESSQLWWDITLVYVQLEEFKEADRSIRKMLLLDPDNEDANSLLGYIQYRLENYEEAANAYENAGEAEGEGVTFFDAKTASQRMKKSSGAK